MSVALQALMVISMGSIAATNRPLLLTFALLGASAIILYPFLSSSSPLWFLSALCFCRHH
ncbi:hypothetical protein HD554DRAFT_2073245, partial [Boletus coccyginus]